MIEDEISLAETPRDMFSIVGQEPGGSASYDEVDQADGAKITDGRELENYFDIGHCRRKFSEILGIPKDKVRFGAEPRYKSIASAKFLSSNRGLEQSEQHDIVAEAYELIESDLSSRKLTPSKKLWVPRVRFDWSTDHETAEVPLERSVAGLFRLYRLLLTENPQADPVWFNQIPVSSGIIQHGKGSRAIDLVCRRSRGQYDFVELKFPKGAPTETPLFAALEVLKYGLIYLYVLCHPGVLKVPGWPDKSDMPKNARGKELRSN